MPRTKPLPRLFGSHLSIAGGLHHALEAADALGLPAVQIFSKNQQQWTAPPLTAEAIATWKARRATSGVRHVVVHASYLLNIAAGDPTVRDKTVAGLVEELRRCAALDIPHLVMHPGSHGGAGVPAGLKRAAEVLDEAMAQTADSGVVLLLETTAGQGSSLGACFEELADLLARVRHPKRYDLCVDTAHLFAAGYDLAGDYDAVMDRLDRTVGLKRVKCLHVNDSSKPLGSRVDRHAHIGHGLIGRLAFRHLVTDPRFADVPMILETPKDKDEKGRDWDAVNVAVLARMARGCIPAKR